MSQTAFKGSAVQLGGNLPRVGAQAPAFALVGADLATFELQEAKGKWVVLNIFPSIDTGVCAASVRRFNAAAAQHPDALVLCISADLPFAQGRFCGAEGLERVKTLSTFRAASFGHDYGVAITTSPLAGLLARAVVVVDPAGVVQYVELVPEIGQEPDYDAALKFLGHSLNTTNASEIAAARDVVIRWKRNLAKFENEQYKNGVASGEFLVVHGYNGDVSQVMEENDDIAYTTPREGVSLACDEMVIPKGARQVELAHRFINFLHTPEVAAENIKFVFYLCPNLGAYRLLDPATLEDETIFLPQEIRERSEVVRDLGPANALYIRAWDAIKAAA